MSDWFKSRVLLLGALSRQYDDSSVSYSSVIVRVVSESVSVRLCTFNMYSNSVNISLFMEIVLRS